ncbi:hypothetical protein FBU30_005966 [Linnemannia zychae]|nr:hypothetical protein FBU30_005966 [Linnemannia zychae]
MEYVNPTTFTFVAAGAGAGAYYIYSNVIEPQNQAQRILQAKQAEKELLLNLEEEASRRGTNKQVKKKSVVVTRPKRAEDDTSDVKPEDLNNNISVSNSFDLLEGKNAINAATTKPKKVASKKKADVNVPVAEHEEPVLKTVKFDPKPEIKELPKAVSKKERRAAKKEIATTATITNSDSPAVIQLTVAASAAAESTKVLKKQEAGSPREPEQPYTLELFKPVRGRGSIPTPIEPIDFDTFQPVKPSRSVQARKHQQQQQEQQSNETGGEKKMVVEPSSPDNTVPSISREEHTLVLQELNALKALNQARDLALSAAESRAERAARKIQELQKQIESEAALVKSAKKTESRVQKLSEKVDSLHYTNSILVRELTTEKENLKSIQLNVEKNAGAELEIKLKMLEQEQVLLVSQVEQLQKSNHELQQHRTQSKTEIAKLSQSLHEADQRAESALQEQAKVHDQLSIAVSNKEARIATLEAEISALEGELENSKVQVEEYAQAITQIEETSQSRHEILEGEKHLLIEEIDLLKSQLVEEQSKASEKGLEFKKLQEELVAIKEQMQKLEADHANDLSAKHKEHQHVMSTKESVLAVHVANLASSQTEVENVRQQLKEARDNYQGELVGLSQELEKSNTQIVTLTESLQEWKAKMAELTERSNESNTKAQEHSASLCKRIQELEQEMDNKESSHRLVMTEKEDLTVKLSTLETAHGNCHERYEALENEKNTLAAELLQKKIDFEELDAVKQGVDAELEALIEASDAKKSEIEQEYEALSLRVVELEEEVESLRQQKQTDENQVEKSSEQQRNDQSHIEVEGLAVASN